MCKHCENATCGSPETCAAFPRRIFELPPSLLVPIVCKGCKHECYASWPSNWSRVSVECPKCKRRRCLFRGQMPEKWRKMLREAGEFCAAHV